MRRWLRSAGLTAVTVLLLGALGSCGPKPLPNVAMTLDSSGTPVVLAVPCEGMAVSYIAVYHNRRDATSADPVAPTWKIVRSGESPDDQMEFPAFVTPGGWELRTDDLTSFEDTKAYGVLVDVGDRDDAVLSFTLADLKSLASGQVWAGETGHAVDRSDFEEGAVRSCH